MRTYGEEVGALAEKQGGRAQHEQLVALGLTVRQIVSWTERKVLTWVRPKVYAVGYVRTDLVALVWEAILYAGPGAYLTGMSAAHQCGLIDHPPVGVAVATPRKCQSLPGIRVRQLRPETRAVRNGIPVAPITELMLDLAAEGNFNLVRKALANLDYRRQLDVAMLHRACRKGRQGSALLRRALEKRLPQLAYVNGDLELAFLLLLEAKLLPLPKFNVRVHGILVDAYWKELGLVVELDGGGNHGTAAQKRRDANHAATLRAHGLTVIRFDWWDVHDGPPATLAALARAGVRR